MSRSVLVDLYRALPQPQFGDDPEAWAAKLSAALDGFRSELKRRYTEGTLQRLLDSDDVETRRAAVLATGLIGSMVSNADLARCLHDDDLIVRQMAADALWAVWFRGGTEFQNRELQRLIRITDVNRLIRGLNELIEHAPEFAEAINQRAIVHFRAGEFNRAMADCQRVLVLNPYHFGAAAGLAQCYLRLNRPRAALKAFRAALQINPNLTEVERSIRGLEDTLGES